MNVEALWIARFGDSTTPTLIPGLTNAGVMVLETGRIYGGDAKYYYIGNYNISGDNITAVAKSTHFNGPRTDVFGGNGPQFLVKLVGRISESGNQIAGYIYQEGRENERIAILLEKKEALP